MVVVLERRSGASFCTASTTQNAGSACTMGRQSARVGRHYGRRPVGLVVAVLVIFRTSFLDFPQCPGEVGESQPLQSPPGIGSSTWTRGSSDLQFFRDASWRY
jgi:hypothetical protein